MSRIKLVLMDIEGTTSSIDFVHQTLFPYSKERMGAFLEQAKSSEDVQNALEQVRATLQEEQSQSNEAEALVRWIEQDRKHPGLKKIQGMIWREGFESGELKGHFYADVPEVLKKWKNQGISLGVYSSGSVQAQKLLYTYSMYGDLSGYIDFYFDTQVGHKREVDSYLHIGQEVLKKLQIENHEILFLSDITEELEAAREAKMQTCLLLREGSAQSDGEFFCAEDFYQVSEKFNFS